MCVAAAVAYWYSVPLESSGEGGDKTKNIPKPGGRRMREFLVKWTGKSYWDCSWVDEIRVS